MKSNTYFADESYTFYGVALVIEEKKQLEILEEYSCLTNNELQAKKFVKLCNELNLQEEDLRNVIEDFIVLVEEN